MYTVSNALSQKKDLFSLFSMNIGSILFMFAGFSVFVYVLSPSASDFWRQLQGFQTEKFNIQIDF